MSLAISHEFEFVGKLTHSNYRTAITDHSNDNFTYVSKMELPQRTMYKDPRNILRDMVDAFGSTLNVTSYQPRYNGIDEEEALNDAGVNPTNSHGNYDSYELDDTSKTAPLF